MKNKKFRKVICLILACIMICPSVVCAAQTNDTYKHDPRLNSVAAEDIIYDSTAVYGFKPNPESARLGSYANFDWSDEKIVNSARLERMQYFESVQALKDLCDELFEKGESIETVAREISTKRNEIRLASYANNPEGLAALKQSNLENFGNETGPTPEYLFEKYGSWEVVLEKAFSLNPGMDACLGLYDLNYAFYIQIGQYKESYYTDAMQWGYDENLFKGITDNIYSELEKCNRAEAITLIWNALGSPKADTGVTVFGDINNSDYFYDAVSWAYEEGVTTGTSETTFSPSQTLTRAQVLTLLYRCIGDKQDAENKFTDVASDAWYYDAVLWAVAEGITTGATETTFSPYNLCKRADAVTFMWRSMN